MLHFSTSVSRDLSRKILLVNLKPSVPLKTVISVLYTTIYSLLIELFVIILQKFELLADTSQPVALTKFLKMQSQVSCLAALYLKYTRAKNRQKFKSQVEEFPFLSKSNKKSCQNPYGLV